MKKILLLLLVISTLHAVEEYPVVVLGSGVASLTSATYLARGGISPLVITGPVIGGTLNLSHSVQNWPGEEEIIGSDLVEKMRAQAEKNGALICPEMVVGVDLSKRPFVITTKQLFERGDATRTIKAGSLIIGLGSTPNLLGVPGEMKYWSHGVFACAVCDGFLYKDRVVAVAGGGDSALTEAQYLSNLAREVILIVRRDQFRTVEKERAAQILSKPNIRVIYETTIQEIKGDQQKVTHLILQNSQNKSTQALPVDALFLAIGSTPNTTLFRNQLEMDSNGYIVLKHDQETSTPGVYAIGDIADPEYKQAVTAAGDGARAAMQAQKHVTSHSVPLKESFLTSSVRAIDIASKEQFTQEIASATGPIFVDFYSTRCPPCRMFSPVYDTWAKEFSGRIKFLKVNADKVPQLFDQYQIRGVPTLIVFDSTGKQISKGSGGDEISYLSNRLNTLKDQPEILPSAFKR